MDFRLHHITRPIYGRRKASRSSRGRRSGIGDVDTLSARILEQEHRAYPEALAKLLTLPWRLEGRRVVFAGGGRP